MKCICEYLEEDYIKWTDRPYISTKENGNWHSRTFRETIDDIRNLSKALLERGFEDKNGLPMTSKIPYQPFRFPPFFIPVPGKKGFCLCKSSIPISPCSA